MERPLDRRGRRTVTRKTKYRLKQLNALAMAMLTGLEALPAFAQSDAERNVADSAGQPQDAVVSYVQEPVVQTPTLYPRVSFNATGSKEWHVYVDANLHAYHFDRQAVKDYHFNENNLGLGLEAGNDVFRIMVGQYHNSIWRNSTFFLAGYTPFQFDITSKDRVNLGPVAGVVSGYLEDATVQVPYTITDPVRGFQSTRYRTENTQKPRGFMPAAGLLLSYEHDHKWGVNLIAVPNVKRAGIYGFVGVQGRIAIPSSWF